MTGLLSTVSLWWALSLVVTAVLLSVLIAVQTSLKAVRSAAVAWSTHRCNANVTDGYARAA